MNMKYVVTESFIGNHGGVVFDPAYNVEIFDCYIAALRWVSSERNLCRECYDKIILRWNDHRSPFGRDWILEITKVHGESRTIIRLARINENGYH